jgi:ABC-type transport system involved in multi-copper enzyme maturation permease subunit
MSWVVWRQHRNQAYFAAAALAAFAVLMLVTGLQMASQYHSALTLCTASHSCSNLANTLNLESPWVSVLITLTVAVPCLLGVFLGGPLVARECETGTSQFTWMQGITRARWLTITVGWVLLAAAAWGGAVSALVTWWSSPVNSLELQNFQPSQFDIQGIVPIGYAVFAVALGVAAGALLRRTLPAMAVTLVVFTLLRLLVSEDFRSHFLTPVTKTFSFLQPARTVFPTGSYWMVSSGLVGRNGPVPSGPLGAGETLGIDGIRIPVSELPSACRTLLFQAPSKTTSGFPSCMAAHGYHAVISYQPAGRYWAFQGIETGIFVFLAAALIAVTAIVVLRRDA